MSSGTLAETCVSATTSCLKHKKCAIYIIMMVMIMILKKTADVNSVILLSLTQYFFFFVVRLAEMSDSVSLM